MIEMEMEREGLLEEKDKWERERDEIDKMEMEIKWLLEKKDKWERALIVFAVLPLLRGRAVVFPHPLM